MLSNAPHRPLIRYHGGKWQLAKWIIGHFPTHSRYVEPYCGGASVLLKKPRCYAEIINDLNGDVVNLFEVLQEDCLKLDLVKQMHLTLYSRKVYEQAITSDYNDCVGWALNFLIRSHMGFNPASPTTGFRKDSARKCSIPAHNWAQMDKVIIGVADRLRGVIVENQPAIKVMQQHDCGDTLHFIDPPYLPTTRSATSSYVHDMTKQDHVELLECVQSLKGMVVICGYQSQLYYEMLEKMGWQLVKKSTFTAQKTKRIECLWLNSWAEERLARGI